VDQVASTVFKSHLCQRISCFKLLNFYLEHTKNVTFSLSTISFLLLSKKEHKKQFFSSQSQILNFHFFVQITFSIVVLLLLSRSGESSILNKSDLKAEHFFFDTFAIQTKFHLDSPFDFTSFQAFWIGYLGRKSKIEHLRSKF